MRAMADSDPVPPRRSSRLLPRQQHSRDSDQIILEDVATEGRPGLILDRALSVNNFVVQIELELYRGHYAVHEWM